MHYAPNVGLAIIVTASKASGSVAVCGDVAKPIEHDDAYNVKLFSIDITDKQDSAKKHGKFRKKFALNSAKNSG